MSLAGPRDVQRRATAHDVAISAGDVGVDLTAHPALCTSSLPLQAFFALGDNILGEFMA